MATFSKPTTLPEWASSTVNILEPPLAKKQDGWLFQEIPPSNFENWRANNVFEWFQWINERLSDGANNNNIRILDPSGNYTNYAEWRTGITPGTAQFDLFDGRLQQAASASSTNLVLTGVGFRGVQLRSSATEASIELGTALTLTESAAESILDFAVNFRVLRTGTERNIEFDTNDSLSFETSTDTLTLEIASTPVLEITASAVGFTFGAQEYQFSSGGLTNVGSGATTIFKTADTSVSVNAASVNVRAGALNDRLIVTSAGCEMTQAETTDLRLNETATVPSNIGEYRTNSATNKLHGFDGTSVLRYRSQIGGGSANAQTGVINLAQVAGNTWTLAGSTIYVYVAGATLSGSATLSVGIGLDGNTVGVNFGTIGIINWLAQAWFNHTASGAGVQTIRANGFFRGGALDSVDRNEFTANLSNTLDIDLNLGGTQTSDVAWGAYIV